VLHAGLDANANWSGADRLDGDAAALKHRDETKTVRAVNDDLEAGVSGFDAARVMGNRAQVGTATRQLATVAPFPPLVGQNGSQTDRGGRRNATPLCSAAVGGNHRTQDIRPGKAAS
jgi:hypothetical protein